MHFRKHLVGIGLAFGLTMVPPAEAADRVITLSADNQFAGTVRLGEPSGGPAFREVMTPDLATLLFKEDGGKEPVSGWFTRTYRAALKTNGMLAKKPEAARYELNAEVLSMAITPLATGAHHKSKVIYRLRDASTGSVVWQQEQSVDENIQRGIRFGKMFGAMGAAAGGAITGQNPAVTAAQITASQGRIRPFDVLIDVAEGIMKGFQGMAKATVVAMAALPKPLPPLVPVSDSAPATTHPPI